MAVEVAVTGKAEKHPMIQTLKQRIQTKADSLFRALGLTEPELSVVLTDDDEIQKLNADWRGIDAPTDVLSFPLWEPGEIPEGTGVPLGDIVISVPYAQRICESAGHRERVAQSLDVDPESLSWSLPEEVDFLLIHGLLHLLGHDHAEADEEIRMRREEARLWRASAQDHPD